MPSPGEPPAGPPPGWYPDPLDSSIARYWDGQAWVAVAAYPTGGASKAQPMHHAGSAPSGFARRQRYRGWTIMGLPPRQAVLLVLAALLLSWVFSVWKHNSDYVKEWGPGGTGVVTDCELDNLREYHKALGEPCEDLNGDGVIEWP